MPSELSLFCGCHPEPSRGTCCSRVANDGATPCLLDESIHHRDTETQRSRRNQKKDLEAISSDYVNCARLPPRSHRPNKRKNSSVSQCLCGEKLFTPDAAGRTGLFTREDGEPVNIGCPVQAKLERVFSGEIPKSGHSDERSRSSPKDGLERPPAKSKDFAQLRDGTFRNGFSWVALTCHKFRELPVTFVCCLAVASRLRSFATAKMETPD